MIEATCIDEGNVCASATTGDCPDGCTDDGSNCAGTATCELGAGGEQSDCPTGCTYFAASTPTCDLDDATDGSGEFLALSMSRRRAPSASA